MRYTIGNLAKSYNPISTFQKSHIHEHTKILLLSALSLLPDEQFNVVVGLPIADFKSQKKELANFLRGDYFIKCAGKEKRIVVKEVAVFPQGIGGLFSQYLSYNGGLIREIPEKVGIVDIGYKDFNFCLLRSGEPDLSASWSYPYGIHEAFKAALTDINKEYDYTLEEIDPKIVPQKHYDNLKKKLINLINPFWKNKDFPVYCCGGGSHWIKIGEQLDNPVFANAIGFRKVANLKWP